jgi:hypothetical protein
MKNATISGSACSSSAPRAQALAQRGRAADAVEAHERGDEDPHAHQHVEPSGIDCEKRKFVITRKKPR